MPETNISELSIIVPLQIYNADWNGVSLYLSVQAAAQCADYRLRRLSRLYIWETAGSDVMRLEIRDACVWAYVRESRVFDYIFWLV